MAARERRGPRLKQTTPASDSPLGERIRFARLREGMTLQEAAKRAEISVSALSKIENGRVEVKYATLQKLSRALNLAVAAPAPTPEAAARGARVISRAGAVIEHDSGPYLYRLHGTELRRKAMFPTLIRVRARSLGDFAEWNQHEGEEFVFVVSGAIHLLFEQYEPVALHAGDSAYYDSGLKHAIVSVSTEDAEVMSVAWSPTRLARLSE
ncbi:MAG TPA: XRE family transcriptional regulator [Azospirillaceae bacterium]|nr:XRE family transcriptional regulator [Azospirillaceae bacterium]